MKWIWGLGDAAYGEESNTERDDNLEPHLQEELGAGLVCYEKDSAAVE
jgi:hypothetical protein